MARPTTRLRPREDTDTPAPVITEAPIRVTPGIEVLASGTDHGVVLVRERAINLRDNLVRVADGERLDRARDLLDRAVAVALGKE